MSTPSVILPDPLITVGRLRILRRVDSRAFVYDPELPPFRRTVHNRTFATTDEAVAFAKTISQETT